MATARDARFARVHVVQAAKPDIKDVISHHRQAKEKGMEILRRVVRWRIMLFLAWAFLCFMCNESGGGSPAHSSGISLVWGRTTIADDPPIYKDNGLDARHLHAGTFGDDYPRALNLADGSWLLVFTTFAQGDSGYLLNHSGGNILVILRSKDDGRTWAKVSVISDPGRDIDNGEMIQLTDGAILLAARSVRWQESYRLPVYKSSDNGVTWKLLSSIDSNEGKPGELGMPDKGVYEPHFYQISPGVLGVMFSTEKHVTESPSYSQTVAEKISTDGGRSWGNEIWVAAGGPLDRPGMPVWTRMKNGQFIVVYEVCGPQACMIHSKISSDGMRWGPGLGTPIPLERGAPYLLCLADGHLVLTANNHHVAMSNDNGESWDAVNDAFPGGPKAAFFSSIYEIRPDHILLMTGQERPQGGRRIAIRDGEIVPRSTSTH